MAPGRKGLPKNRQPAELPTSEYEKVRALNMMRNNQRLQSLGISTMKSILNTAVALSKGTAREGTARADSGSLYEPTDDEDAEQGAVDKGSGNDNGNSSTPNTTIRPVASRLSKRVMAPEEHDQPTRLTRKRTREISSTVGGSDGTTLNQEDVANRTDALEAAICPTEFDEQIIMSNEGQPNDMIQRRYRGRSIGRDLEQLNRGLSTKIPIHVAEGKRRPEATMQAAKLASEGGIILRQHIPILPHWKEYKKDEPLLDDFVDKVGGHFTMDVKNKAVKEACSDILKCGQRQMRYKLKKLFFDGVPANQVRTTSPLDHMTDEQWRNLVTLWSNPKHMEKCIKNKENREKVQFHQRTGSRSYIAHLHALKQDKYKDVNPNAIDLFKDCHFSTKTGYSEPVKKAIDDMEAMLAEPTEEGQEPKSPTKVVSEVLPKSKFLQNIGLESATPKISTKNAVAARVQELEDELESEKQGSAELRDKVERQQLELEAMKKHVEEIENLKKSTDETNTLLRRLLSINKV